MFQLLAFAVLTHNALVFAQNSSLSQTLNATLYLGASAVVMTSLPPTPTPSATPAATAVQPATTSVAHVPPTTPTAPVAMIEYSANVTLEDYQWNQNYSMNGSAEYMAMRGKIEIAVRMFLNSTGFELKTLKSFDLMKYNDKVMVMLRFIASPLGETIKPKDPTLYWEREVEEKGEIGKLKVQKESTKLKEEIPSGTNVEGWITKKGECETKCGVGPVSQERKCSGNGCGMVQKTRWVTCEQGECGTGQHLMSSVPLLIATLMMILMV